MIQRGPSIFPSNPKTPDRKIEQRRKLLRAIESAISIALSMTPLGLIALYTVLGA
jgi:hypothetical protein